jgi:hypothetical protein
MQAKIKIKNGYWTYNGVAVKNCPFPIQKLVASFIKTQMFNNEVRKVKVSRPVNLHLDSNLFSIPNFVKL